MVHAYARALRPDSDELDKPPFNVFPGTAYGLKRIEELVDKEPIKPDAAVRQAPDRALRSLVALAKIVKERTWFQRLWLVQESAMQESDSRDCLLCSSVFTWNYRDFVEALKLLAVWYEGLAPAYPLTDTDRDSLDELCEHFNRLINRNDIGSHTFRVLLQHSAKRCQDPRDLQQIQDSEAVCGAS